MRRYKQLVGRILTRLDVLLEAEPDVKDLRAMASTLKDLKDIQGVCTDLELREREAKIESLRRRTEPEAVTLTVAWEEEVKDYAQ